jgi:hypothetical protein
MAIVVAIFLGTLAPQAEPQDTDEAARPHKSVYGKLLGVDRSQNIVLMTSDAGDNLSWRFEPEVVAEAARFEPGAAMIVIYRQLPGNVKRVTALAFPGAEKAPTYVNLTGERVVLRSAAMVDGACERAGEGPVTESVIPRGGRAEALHGCWCCAVSGETCSPTTKSGVGRAYLAQCFK